jgi:hypothetical protein
MMNDLLAIELKDPVNAALSDAHAVIDCDFKIQVEGEVCDVYEASVSYRDILLLTDKGTVTYFVDSYGDRHVVELFDWDFDQE